MESFFATLNQKLIYRQPYQSHHRTLFHILKILNSFRQTRSQRIQTAS